MSEEQALQEEMDSWMPTVDADFEFLYEELQKRNTQLIALCRILRERISILEQVVEKQRELLAAKVCVQELRAGLEKIEEILASAPAG